MRRGQVIIVLAFAMTCAGAWSERDAFYGEMRCDLSIDNVRPLVERHHGKGWICRNPTERLTECSFKAGKTRVIIEFEDGKMRTIEDADHFGLTGMATRPKLDLCSGTKSRAVLIMPKDDSWIGAKILANRQPVGTVSAGNAEYVYLPLGRYELKIEKAGRASIQVDVHVPDGTLREPPTVKLP